VYGGKNEVAHGPLTRGTSVISGQKKKKKVSDEHSGLTVREGERVAEKKKTGKGEMRRKH